MDSDFVSADYPRSVKERARRRDMLRAVIEVVCACTREASRPRGVVGEGKTGGECIVRRGAIDGTATATRTATRFS